MKRPKINEKEAGDGPFYKYSCRKLLQKQLFYGIDPTWKLKLAETIETLNSLCRIDFENYFLATWTQCSQIQHCIVSLGNGGLQIESSKIRISSRPSSIVDYDPIPIPTTL